MTPSEQVIVDCWINLARKNLDNPEVRRSDIDVAVAQRLDLDTVRVYEVSRDNAYTIIDDSVIGARLSEKLGIIKA